MDLVHRDLKPSNIVIQKLNDFESVKIVDFGLAVSIKSRVELMSTCGTLIYQAPEQIFTNARQSKSIDMFACGFILYEMLTGKHPLLQKGEDK
jgi:calcium/calmodulin-dependent protein kinase I